ncbi:MAG: 4Fe-4S binding protein [Clostridia bacterium]|nr:4Fe-4S binding protein [Clostridia bacterium]
MAEIFHSVSLMASRCKGCTACVKHCPTQAIRVRDGKASITDTLCIDCGECIRVCPHHAKRPVYTPLAQMQNEKYKYRVALPAPTLYCQFNNLDDVDYVLTGLKKMGFDDVFEVSAAAEIITDLTRQYMSRTDIPRPVISSACPAVVRLIQKRFPNLCGNLSPFMAPVELAAVLARRRAVEKTGLAPEEIGVFFISPCPAKMTAAIQHLNFDEQIIDGVLSISEVYVRLVGVMNRLGEPEPMLDSGIVGVSWALSGGECAGLLKEKFLAADGIEHVISVLEELEDEKIHDIDYIELNACTAGCVGGCLAVENPYVAKARMKSLRKYMKIACNKASMLPEDVSAVFENGYSYSGTAIADDYAEAMRMMHQIRDIVGRLPSLDCGACGAPTCQALAEDIVCGKASEEDCVYVMREKVRQVHDSLTREQRELLEAFEAGRK